MENRSLRAIHVRWFHRLVGRCQHLAGVAVDSHGVSLADSVATLCLEIPANLAIAERLATRNILTATLARVARLTGLDQRPDVLSIFFDWSICDATSSTWAANVTTFVDRCAIAFTMGRFAGESCFVDARVARAIQMIESGYADRDISLPAVAAHSRLSARHLSRLLERTVGLGFSGLLHRTRIAAAQTLLDRRSLSVKETAAAVGYATSSQFCRHFKRLVGTTPARYRASRSKRID